ncbi:GlxA family transcriptional regulator [Roseospira marina]|uniref:GlxA family transcriptional regulator n=1 Tax=Roseospira marina TaxID=140057 RepID=A0A5M6IGL7_9PROT|nr:GlxA family transcriptional regulator [Roseospira marina]KAA5607451.1 GlxA family transcriptional regulator [Roseospira marina]MBB4312369.1 transcriptional regulator GlxA family with amidase domain [Roseospira marina]MBB5085615.1 transcriptional regulator GlxA family with amidase domain [Roseospira marina]
MMPNAPSTARLKVGFVLLRSFTLLPFAGFVDVLRLAADEGDRSRQIECRWTTMTPDGRSLTASCGTRITPDSGLMPAGGFDYIVVVGGLIHQGPVQDPAVTAYLREAAAAKVPLVGLCTAVFTLIDAGLMRDRQCCVSWYHYQDLIQAFPEVTPVADRLFVVDGPRITCAGGTGAVDLAAWLVDRHLGAAAARKALNILVSDGARPADSPQPMEIGEGTVAVRDPRLRRALTILEHALASPPRASDLARRVGLSRRQLERLFREELNATPSAYARAVRLRHGHWLVTRTGRSVTDIAQECGFADASHFSRHHKAAYGATPQALRTATRPGASVP